MNLALSLLLLAAPPTLALGSGQFATMKRADEVLLHLAGSIHNTLLVKGSVMAASQPNVRGWRFIDLTNKRFGRLTVLSVAFSDSNGVSWNCKCDCGKERVVKGSPLRAGITVSCGCYGTEQRRKAATKHGATANYNKKLEYKTWCEIKSRCSNPSAAYFEYYGGRGIKVCDRWLSSFAAFLEDMGDKPTPQHTIDRIDSNGNYEPGNCRWATRKEQLRNTSRTRHITSGGRTQCLTDWAIELGMGVSTLRYRIKKWGVEKALAEPVNEALGRRTV